MRFAYVNTENKFPHDIHLIDGLRQLGHEVTEIYDKSRGIRKYLNIAKRLRAQRHAIDAIIVGFTSPLFVPLVRLVSPFGMLIFNGVSSQYEANVISREAAHSGFLETLKWLMIDFVSFHCASRVLLESNAQIEYIHRLFLIPRKKLIRSWTGMDEKEFFFDPNVQKRTNFTVLFRGRFLPESGILTVIKAAKILEGSGIHFIVIGHGFLHREVTALVEHLSPKNLEMYEKRLSIDELRKLMLSCHISLGQLADHPRLDRTLPCKLFESLALGLPYLTGRNKAALELLTEGVTCACANPGDEHDLARQIVALKSDPNRLASIGKNGFELYRSELTAKTLTQSFLNACFGQQL